MSRAARLIQAMKDAGLDIMSAAYGNGGISAYINGDDDAWERFTATQRPATDQFGMVLDFHRKFGCKIGEHPGFPDDKTAALRCKLIDEELTELKNAIAAGDLVEVADALADLLYVVNGSAVTFGIDIRPVFAEVHRTNMAKVGGGERADGKILKPPGWQPPGIAPLLEGMRLTAETEETA